MKSKIFLTYSWSALLILLGTVNAHAQGTASAAPEASAMDWVFNNMFLILGVSVFLAGCLTVFRLFDRMIKAEQMSILAEKGLLTADSVLNVQKEPLWKRLSEKAWNIVPFEREKDILLAHPHDGIYELDNDLPPWWLGLFYASIAFGVFYIGYKHFSEYGKTQAEEYEFAVKKAEVEIKEYLAGQANLVDETNAEPLTDDARLASGAKIFKDNCVACHGALGEGVIGPNMTDEYWIYGGDVKDIFRTVKNGATKGMKSWKDDLTASQIHEVASFILTLQGSNPPNAKEPEGEKYELISAVTD